jgi:hypothetical protein
MAIVKPTGTGNIALELGGKAAGWLRRLQPPGYEVAQVAGPAGELILQTAVEEVPRPGKSALAR